MTATFWMPLPGGASVPLDAMGQPDFSRMMAGAEVATAGGGPLMPAAPGAAPPLRLVETPTFRSATTVRDPRWLIFAVFALALLLASER